MSHNNFDLRMDTGAPKAHHRRETAARILVYTAVILWFAFIALFERYSYTRPSAQNVETGRVYEHNNHGHITYLTAREHDVLIGMQIGAFVIFISGTLVEPEKRIWRWGRR